MQGIPWPATICLCRVSSVRPLYNVAFYNSLNVLPEKQSNARTLPANSFDGKTEEFAAQPFNQIFISELALKVSF